VDEDTARGMIWAMHRDSLDSLNSPKRCLFSHPYSPLCVVMSVRTSAFGVNHRRSASTRPLEASSTTQRQTYLRYW